MAKETIEVLIEGGKATAAPPLGPKLGPLKVNIGAIVDEINNKTKDFGGMQVPVKVVVDTETKEFEVSIGTPPATQLIKNELNISKGSSTPNSSKVGDLSFDQAKKIANMKFDSVLSYDLKTALREIGGTCNSMGVTVDKKPGRKFIMDVWNGKYDGELS